MLAALDLALPCYASIDMKAAVDAGDVYTRVHSLGMGQCLWYAWNVHGECVIPPELMSTLNPCKYTSILYIQIHLTHLNSAA